MFQNFLSQQERILEIKCYCDRVLPRNKIYKNIYTVFFKFKTANYAFRCNYDGQRPTYFFHRDKSTGNALLDVKRVNKLFNFKHIFDID